MPAEDPRAALVGLYAPPDPLLVSGDGPWVTDAQDRRYLDFTSGIGVNALGHGAPEVREALLTALSHGLVHTSNLFRTAPAEALARELSDASTGGRVFFCNSGAEAGEAAFKFARRWARAAGDDQKTGIVAFQGSFHGRLFGTLAATDRPTYRAPFEPLMPGVTFCPVGDEEAVDRAIDADRTAAVVIEPVQGEGGIRPVPAPFLARLREWCDTRDVALIFDEVQCGLGRTGRLFAYEHAGVVPDLLMLAKPLAGGLPMGAVVASDAIAEALRPGDHATTFGGGPLVAAVARAVLRTISEPAFLDALRIRSDRLESGLRELAREVPSVREVRGLGMMWGVEVDGPAGAVVTAARAEGLLLCTAGADTVRIMPPLNTPDDALDEGLERLRKAFAEAAKADA